jgi:hypothetical protein
LNADDDPVYQMTDSLNSNIALFGVESRNPRIAQHIVHGNLAAFTKDGWSVIS